MARRAKVNQISGTLQGIQPTGQVTPVVARTPVIARPGTIPVLSFEMIWQSSTINPPFNVTKARQLIERLRDPVDGVSIQDATEISETLSDVLQRSPALNDDQLRERFGMLPLNLTNEQVARLKQLLLIVKATNIRDLLPITLLEAFEFQQLGELRYLRSGELIINLADRPVVCQINYLLLMLGYSVTFDFLVGVQTPRDIFFNNPLMKRARDKSIIDLKILKWKPNVTTGVKCKRCGEKKVLVSEKQLRSADEPATVFYKCTSCNNDWRVG